MGGLPGEPSEHAVTLSVGDHFRDRYVLVARLGAGGMGVVFEAEDAQRGHAVALKVMLPSAVVDEDLRSRFRREADVPGDVESPHLVRVFEAGVDERTGLPFIAMERLVGEDLRARLRRGPLPLDEVVTILRQLGAALDATHAAGIVHRDLKPENLFLAAEDDREILKILDFGVAKHLAASGASLHSTRTLGSPLYMSPEQLEGEATIDGRSDVYALGHVAFTLLVGEAYWEASWRKARGVFPVVVKVMRGTIEPASRRAEQLGRSLPRGFDGWFARATARDPDARFDTAGVAVEALVDALADRAPLRRRARWPIAVAALFATGGVGATAATRGLTAAEPGAHARQLVAAPPLPLPDAPRAPAEVVDAAVAVGSEAPPRVASAAPPAASSTVNSAARELRPLTVPGPVPRSSARVETTTVAPAASSPRSYDPTDVR